MTPQEHELMATMFAKQLRYIELLVQILQSREIIEGDDLAAFLSLVRSDERNNAAALRAAKAEYRKAAKEIGLRVGFPKR
jgi:hypothetical protein